MPSSSRLVRSLAAGSLLTGAVLGLTSPAPAGAAPTADAVEALAWLADELVAADGVFVYDSGFGEFTDYGLTLDAVIALTLGSAGEAAVDAALEVFETEGSAYFAPGDDRYAGALAKTLLAHELLEVGTTVDGVDLEAALRARIDAAGETAGRFRDVSSFGDFSNGFSQALGVLALSHTDGGAPASTVDDLLDQQCPGGGFRTVYTVDADFDGVPDPETTPGCEGAGESDPDATALAVQALLAEADAPGAAAAITSAVAYLDALTDGNANTLGLVGQALRAAGSTAAADEVAADVAALQFPSGAIALNPAAVTAGEAASTPQALWRNTAQGVLALGLGPLGVVPAPPASTTTSTTEATTSTTAAPASSTTTSAAGGATTSTTARSGAIPRTGSDARDQVALALVLLGAGTIVLGQAKLRERPGS